MRFEMHITNRVLFFKIDQRIIMNQLEEKKTEK